MPTPGTRRAAPPHSAAGHPAMVQLLARAGADVNVRDDNGETPLHRAVRAGSPTAVARLLELGADPGAVDDSSRVADPAVCSRWPTPVFFHHATVDVVARCMGAGAEADSGHVVNGYAWAEWYPDRSTPLHVAAGWTRDPAVIGLLVGAGAEVNATNAHGYSPLHYAARNNGDPAVIGALIAAGAEVNAWATGTWSGEPLPRNPDWDVTPLHEAARSGSAEVVAALVEAGARINAAAAGGRMPLHDAAAGNADPEVVTALVRAGANVNAKLAGGRTPLHEAAARNGNPAVAAALLEAGAQVNARGNIDEVWEDRFRAAAALSIAFGVNPWGWAADIPATAGNRTPLHEAAADNSNPEVVELLIAAGAELHAAGDLERHDEPAGTPLHWAASMNPDATVLELLVRAGADVNAPGGSGRTPLHMAALRNPVVFPVLLALGADPEALDRHGKTPMDYAVDNLWLQGWDQVRRLLEARGNEPG